MKRFALLLAALLLAACPALAQGESLILTATVQPTQTLAVKAPASGELAPFTLRAGDRVAAGDTLFQVEPKRVYADLEGTVAAIFAKPGDIADAVTARYQAVMYVDYAQRYELRLNAQTGYNSVDNRDLHIGTPVYLRSTNESHFADGMITATEGLSFTVQVLGGDLVYNQEVKVYRESDYSNSSLLARGRLSYVSPRAISVSGTITEMGVARGDAVHPGDYLFSYVPDVLEPELRGNAQALKALAEEASIVSRVNVEAGATVQKGQVLAMVIRENAYELVAHADEADVARLQAGDTMQVRFEELDLPANETQLLRVSPLGEESGDTSSYTLYFSLPVAYAAQVWPGMHATLER